MNTSLPNKAWLPLSGADIKTARAKVILSQDYINWNKYTGIVCFTSGHSGAALQREGINLHHISGKNIILCGPDPVSHFVPTRWYSQKEIQQLWPGCFDATSGHLSVYLMMQIGLSLRTLIGQLNSSIPYWVPSGSGETIVSLSLAYPKQKFVAVYNMGDENTEWSGEAPLNALVVNLAHEVKLGASNIGPH